MAALLFALAKMPVVVSQVLLPFNAYLPRVRTLPGICLAMAGATTFVANKMRQIMATEDPRRLTRWEQIARVCCQLLQVPWSCLRSPSHAATALDDSTLEALFIVSY